MWSQFVQVGQLHIIAKEMAQMGIGIARHGQLVFLKRVGRQWEYLVSITGIMERDTHTTSDGLEREDV